MATAVAPSHRLSQNPKRTPLLPSESGDEPRVRRTKGREVTSRYLSSLSTSSSSNSSASTNTTFSSVSSTSSRRIQSPMLGGKSAVATPRSQQRAVSAERRRTPAATPSSAERMLVTSMRSLSLSFQGESYALPASKVKPPPTTVGTPAGSRKGTPERRKAAVTPARDRKERDRENSKPSNQQQQQHRWPGRLRSENSNLLTRSLDYGAERVQSVGSGSALKELRKSAPDANIRIRFGSELYLPNDDTEVRGISHLHSSRDSMNSDAESVSSGSTSSGNATQLNGKPRGLVMPARFRQDASNKTHKVQYPDLPSPNSVSNRTIGQSKLIAAKKFQTNGPAPSPKAVLVSTSRGLSPQRGIIRPASPSKAMTPSTGAMLRSMASPSRARNGLLIPMNESSSMCSTPSIFHFSVDARKGKLGENRIADAHDLRLLYNRLLQWRLANAKREHTLLAQKHTAERSLYSAWVKNSKLLHVVGSKRVELQLLRRNLKLYHILKEQEPHLECWGVFDRDHCNSVSAAIEALKASIIRLPILGGAKADVHKVQAAISSAVDVLQAMASSICSLLSKVEQMSLLASEISNMTARGQHLLDECRDFLSITFIPLQVMHCSTRTHAMQVQQEAMYLETKLQHADSHF